MTIDDNIRHEKLQYDINREEAKISALSSEDIEKCSYLTDEKILPTDQGRVTVKAKFTYSPLRKGKKIKEKKLKIKQENKYMLLEINLGFNQ